MRRRAFTIIELVIVLTILAVASAIAIPRFSAAQGQYRVDAAANRIAADLAAAAQNARSISGPYHIFFAAASDRYRSGPGKAVDSGYIDGQSVVTLIEVPYQSEIMAATFGSNQGPTFDGFGIPDSAGSVIVRSGRRSFRTISMDASGVVTITTPSSPSSTKDIKPDLIQLKP